MQENKKIGWDYIEEKMSMLYPNQKPKHYGTMIKYSMGGKDPLDGISIYDAGEYYHFVTFGLSELYEKVSDNKELSGFGIELTYKLKKNPEITEEELKNILNILQFLGKYIFDSRVVVKPYEYIATGQTQGMDLKQLSKIVGFVTIEDPLLKTIDTINGKVQFIQIIGATYNELNKITSKEISKDEIINKILSQYGDVTDYLRNDIIM